MSAPSPKDENGSAQNKGSSGSWTSLLKSLTSFNGDISSFTAPPFILSPTSLVEYSSYWAEHPSIFVAPASEPDPAKRALLVLKWFLSTLKQQYSSRNDKLGSEKKPLNPFLGELFLGKWDDEAGTTHLVSEQVSHHPPVTGYHIWNDKHGVRLTGYNGQKASVTRRIDVKQIGHAILHVDKFDEDYLITLPSLHIEGIIYGAPFVELNKCSYIQSSTGYTAKIDYSGKGWLSGKKNTFTAVLYPEGKEKEPLYTVDGQWTDKFTIRDARTKKEIEAYDAKASQTTPLTVAPIEQQDPFESRRAWKKVAEAILSGDMETTSTEKSKIENEQREMRKQERAEGTEWQRRYFIPTETDPIFEKLAAPIGEKSETEKTGGMWKWDNEKAAQAEAKTG
ncbi:Oxysterol-binding protein [Xylona heveae TC161]|uniref:Oxysterol-binding protein n=1 Tax=Xylona heveae (strain CBS 132557 / TC161) TaxID=1328760 RepID=A0A165FM29_XYLHT|nr:Oxysterol-binding protein [Xylona heveae TC161]KZF21140.1 Oxysterol-binding protein [Xylona heveae TC161]